MMTTTYIMSTFPYILHSDSHSAAGFFIKGSQTLLRAVYTPKKKKKTTRPPRPKWMGWWISDLHVSSLHRIFTHGPTRYTESCRPQAYVSSRVVVKIAPFKMYSVKSFIHIHHSISYEFCWSNHFKSFECC